MLFACGHPNQSLFDSMHAYSRLCTLRSYTCMHQFSNMRKQYCQANIVSCMVCLLLLPHHHSDIIVNYRASLGSQWTLKITYSKRVIHTYRAMSSLRLHAFPLKKYYRLLILRKTRMQFSVETFAMFLKNCMHVLNS